MTEGWGGGDLAVQKQDTVQDNSIEPLKTNLVSHDKGTKTKADLSDDKIEEIYQAIYNNYINLIVTKFFKINIDLQNMSGLQSFEKNAGISSAEDFRKTVLTIHDGILAKIGKENYGKNVPDQEALIVRWDDHPMMEKAVKANYEALTKGTKDIDSAYSTVFNKLRSDNNMNETAEPIYEYAQAFSPHARIEIEENIETNQKHPKAYLDYGYPNYTNKFKEDYFAELNNRNLLRRYENPPHFLKSDKLTQDNIDYIWFLYRDGEGFKGDCRYEWEKFLDLSFAEQVKTLGELDISLWPEDNPDVQKAKARIDMMTPMGITRMATALNGKDTRAILEWGNEFNRERAETFKSPHDKSIRDVEGACAQIKQLLGDYENLLRAQRPTGLRLLFAYMTSGIGKQKSGIAPIERVDGKLQWSEQESRDYRFYTPQQKMARAEVIIDQIEDYYSGEIAAQLDRYIGAEEQEHLAREMKEITSLYVSALKKNRTRLIQEGAKPDTIDNRIIELGRSESACDAEIGHAMASGALHEEMRAQMRGILDVTIPAFRTEMKTMYLRALGNQALTTEFTGKALGGIITDKARAREFADNLNNLADKVRDLSGLQQAMSNNEVLVLEHKQPLALEYRPVLALPAPSDYERD